MSVQVETKRKRLAALLVLAGVILLLSSFKAAIRPPELHVDLAAALAESSRPKAWYEPVSNHPLAVLAGVCFLAAISIGAASMGHLTTRYSRRYAPPPP